MQLKRPHQRCSPEEYDRRWVAVVMAETRRDESGCLIYTGSLDTCGYGQRAYRGRRTAVHRRLYQIVKGVTLAKDQRACHRCDTPACVDPEHIFIGTQKDNQRDMARKGRANGQWKTHCDRGHPLSGDNLYRAPKTGLRACKTCGRARLRIAAGWPEELAYSAPPTPKGQRPVNGKFQRRQSVAI